MPEVVGNARAAALVGDHLRPVVPLPAGRGWYLRRRLRPPASMERIVLNSNEPPRTAALVRRRWQALRTVPMCIKHCGDRVRQRGWTSCPSSGVVTCLPLPDAKC